MSLVLVYIRTSIQKMSVLRVLNVHCTIGWADFVLYANFLSLKSYKNIYVINNIEVKAN